MQERPVYRRPSFLGLIAMFLIAVCRARLGNTVGAQAAARGYLQRYPNGLRRAEAMRMAEGR